MTHATFPESYNGLLEDEIPYLPAILFFITFVYFLEAYIQYRQHKNLKVTKIPPHIAKLDITTQEQFEKAQSYGRDKSSFGFFCDLLGFVENIAIFWYGWLPWAWSQTLVFMETYTNYTAEYEIAHSLFFCLFFTLFSLVKSLPFELYSTFVIEKRHGFNKQTLGLFFVDKIKVLALTFILGGPLLSAALYLIQHTGPLFYMYLFLFSTFVSLVAITIYPTLIAPLFNKFSPLEEGEVREAIYKLAARVEYPLTHLYVVDGSKRSGHSNAYMYGFFKNKRIVLYDTILEQLSTQETTAVLAHELGHWAYSHVIKNFFIVQGYMLCFLYLFAAFLHHSPLYRAFGFHTQPAFIGLFLFSTMYGPIDHVFSFAQNVLSRRAEYQADEYATRLGYAKDLVSALCKISVENKSSLLLDRLYSTYHHTHPTLLERIAHIQESAEKTK